MYATHLPLSESHYSTSSRVKYVQSTRVSCLYSGCTQQSIHMHENKKSQSVWCERMPRSYLSPLDVVVILPGTCAMNHAQLCFMFAGSGQADMWCRLVVVLFGEQLFGVGLLLGAMRKLVSVGCCWITQSCTICYSHTFRSSTPHTYPQVYCTALASHQATPTHIPQKPQECRSLC